MRLKRAIPLVALLLASNAFGKSSSLRIGGAGGYGSGNVSINGVTTTEQPAAMGFTVDYSFDSRRTLGAEHYRTLSLSPMSTGISFTGLASRWYFATPHPQWIKTEFEENSTSLTQKSISPYLGGSLGFSQASLAPVSEKGGGDAVGMFFGLKLGLEYPLFGRFHLRWENAYNFSIAGSGTVNAIFSIFGINFFL